MKRIISMVLSLIIFCTLFSTTTVSAKVKKGKCGKNITYSLSSDKSKLTISGKGEMYNYLSLECYPRYASGFDVNNHKCLPLWIEYERSFEGDERNEIWELAKNNYRISIGKGITSIGANAFYCVADSKSQQTITLPNTVKTIYGGAFSFSGFKTIVLPDNLRTISSEVVYYKNNTVYPMLGSFEYCNSKNIQISEKSKLKTIDCNAFKNSNVNYFNKNNSLPKVTHVGDSAFYGANITNISLPKAEIYKNAFKYCRKLKKADVSGTKKIRAYTFLGCKKLKDVKLGNKLVWIGTESFKGCKALESITIPKNVKEIKDNAFMNDTKLKTVVIKSKKLKTVCTGAFENVNKNVVFKVPKSKLKQYKALISPNAPKNAKFVGI
ncbi:MAG: leucine-rich repeat domain-containing protein [Ruminococcus sp.]